MNAEKARMPAFLVVLFSPGLLFSWWNPAAKDAFWIILCFMFMWFFYWFMWFFGEPYTSIETVNYLVREAQAVILAVEFVLTVVMLLFQASMRTCLYVNGFTFGAFILAACGTLLYHADLIHQLNDEEGG